GLPGCPEVLFRLLQRGRGTTMPLVREELARRSEPDDPSRSVPGLKPGDVPWHLHGLAVGNLHLTATLEGTRIKLGDNDRERHSAAATFLLRQLHLSTILLDHDPPTCSIFTRLQARDAGQPAVSMSPACVQPRAGSAGATLGKPVAGASGMARGWACIPTSNQSQVDLTLGGVTNSGV